MSDGVQVWFRPDPETPARLVGWITSIEPKKLVGRDWHEFVKQVAMFDPLSEADDEPIEVSFESQTVSVKWRHYQITGEEHSLGEAAVKKRLDAHFVPDYAEIESFVVPDLIRYRWPVLMADLDDYEWLFDRDDFVPDGPDEPDTSLDSGIISAGSELLAGSVTSSKIMAGSVIDSKIVTSTVGASKPITAEELLAGIESMFSRPAKSPITGKPYLTPEEFKRIYDRELVYRATGKFPLRRPGKITPDGA
jgi:hypothetical protein